MTTKVMMTLGDFSFEVGSNAFELMSFSKQYLWAEGETINQEVDSFQYLGQKSETLTLSGAAFPLKAGQKALTIKDQLQKEAAKGKPLYLFDYTGKSLGQWIIVSINSERSHLTQEGLAKRVYFSLELKQYEMAK